MPRPHQYAPSLSDRAFQLAPTHPSGFALTAYSDHRRAWRYLMHPLCNKMNHPVHILRFLDAPTEI